MQHVLDRLKGVRPSGDGYVALCPAHADCDPSLIVSPGEGGKILINCRAGCSLGSVLAAIGLDGSDIGPGSTSAEAVTRSREAPSEEVLDARDRVYADLLRSLDLLPQHRKDLLKRGLSEGDIEARGYKSLTFLKGKKALAFLYDKYGAALEKVPGFVCEGGGWKLTASDGLLIPCRAVDGRVQGLQVRLGLANRKYCWLSHREVSIRSPFHWPLGANWGEVVRVTEGPLKADVATVLGGVPTVGVAGSSSWWGLPEELRRMGVKEAHIAFDMDRLEKEGVQAQCDALEDALRGAGLRVEVLSWDPAYKGIDDWQLACLRGRDDLRSERLEAEVAHLKEVIHYLQVLLGDRSSQLTRLAKGGS